MQPHILKFSHILNYKEQFSNRKDNNRKVNIFKFLKNDRFFIFFGDGLAYANYSCIAVFSAFILTVPVLLLLYWECISHCEYIKRCYKG